MKDIHWFPGHMNKAMNEMKEKVSLVDIVLIVLDARAPLCDKDFFMQQIEQIKNKFDEVIYIDILNP